MVADDHSIIRAGVRAVVEPEPDLRIVAEAETGIQAVALAREHQVEIAVLDIEMPGMTGVLAAQQIREGCPNTRVLFLTMYEDPHAVRSAMAAGCAGFVAKKAIASELVAALRHVAGGRSYVSVSMSAADLHTFLSPPSGRDVAPLSAREWDVLMLLAYGYTYEEIGEKLHVSGKTVGTYRTRINEKLGLKTRADVVRYALDVGLLASNRTPEIIDK